MQSEEASVPELLKYMPSDTISHCCFAVASKVWEPEEETLGERRDCDAPNKLLADRVRLTGWILGVQSVLAGGQGTAAGAKGSANNRSELL